MIIRTALLAILCALAIPAIASAQTVVSLEWDDANADQYQVGQMLSNHGMTGTFFVNSGLVGTSGKMSWGELHALATAGNEIAGHTVSHPDLPMLSAEEATRQICNDRVNLMNQGFNVTDFAYPFGDENASVEQIAANCGYNSARTIGGLQVPESCSLCAYAESIPPLDTYSTRTPNSIHTWQNLQEIEKLVTQAEQNGGGWVQLVMHHICEGCDPTYATSPSTLSSLLDWLQPRAAQGTVVRNVSQVMGGSVKPAVAGPPPPPPPSGSNQVWNPSFDNLSSNGMPTCFQQGGFGTNTASVSLSSDRTGTGYSEQLSVSNYVSGDAKILTQMDLGQCAPTLTAGTRYQLSAWYKSSAPTMFTLYTRNALGGWTYWTESQLLPASATWTQATLTTAALPAGSTGLSFGLGLLSNGTLNVDDYSMSVASTVSTGGNMLQNASLESAAANGIPTCFQTGHSGTNTATWSRSTTANSGLYAEQLQISSYTSGDQKLVSAQDSGSCAPSAKAGHQYAVSAWYQSNQSVYMYAYYHDLTKGWVFWKQSAALAASSTWKQATWTTPVFPTNADMISVGLGAQSVGTTTMDDFSLSDADTSPPSVSLTAPAAGATLSGTVSLSASASDSGGQVDHVEFLVDGQLVGSSSTSPYGFNWDSTSVSDGSHTLTARAVDWAGNATVSAPVSVTVSNAPPPDTTPPSVTLTSPTAGAVLGGQVALAASASDNTAVAHVEFLVDGNVIATSSTAPYTASWNSAAVADGPHTLSARAVDTSGNIADAPISVIVDNTPPTSSGNAPALSSSNALTVSYTAADNQGGSGLAEVDLYAKGPQDTAYTKVASDTSGKASGSFAYTATEGDGNYNFYTQATDNAGNLETTHTTADATTLLDTTPPSSSASAPVLSSSNALTVSYTAADASSQIAKVDLWVKGPSDSGYHDVASDTSGKASGSFAYTATEGDGNYNFYTQATDNAGNLETTHTTADATTLLDTKAPTSAASSPTYSNSGALTVIYTASDNTGGSGLASVELWVKAPGASSYANVATNSPTVESGSFNFSASAQGSYSFYTIATDHAGNRQPAPASANSTTLLDTVAPSAFQMTNPGSYVSGNLKLSLSSAPADSGSGMASVSYQYRLSATSNAWSTACTATASPWGCAWNTATKATPDGTYALRALAIDRAGNGTVASNTPLTLTILNAAPTAKSISTSNISGGIVGKVQTGDSMAFTYSTTMNPATILTGWTGAATAVRVKLLTTKTAADTTLTVWNSAGTTQLALANPLDLGGSYVPSAGAVFNATMVQSSTAITVTIGSLVSGSVQAAAVTGGTLSWTPSSGATDLAGNKCSTASVSAIGPAF